MKSNLSPWISIDWTRFDPWRVQTITHALCDHPLLQPRPLTELAARLEESSQIRTHSSAVTAATPFNHAPSLHPNRRSAEDTMRSIKEASAWMSLLNVQTDKIYGELVHEVLESIRGKLDTMDPGMCYRGGWIFVTSPRTVTPFHMDLEHNFLLQIRGTKKVYVWEPDDLEVVSEAARDLFHAEHSRDLVVWKEEFRRRAHVHHLQPGEGAYMPSTSPHMVENSDDASITMSFTYYTDETRRRAALHRLHHRLRKAGVRPPEVRHGSWLDRLLLPLSPMLAPARRADDTPFASAEIG
jgi:Cupin-like domain